MISQDSSQLLAALGLDSEVFMACGGLPLRWHRSGVRRGRARFRGRRGFGCRWPGRGVGGGRGLWSCWHGFGRGLALVAFDEGDVSLEPHAAGNVRLNREAFGTDEKLLVGEPVEEINEFLLARVEGDIDGSFLEKGVGFS